MIRALTTTLLIAAFVAGGWCISHGESYRCETMPNQTALCAVDNGGGEYNTTIFSCRPAGGAAPVEISCSVIYSALQGYTWTGVRGINWVCGKDTVLPDSEFQDKKATCDKLCGACEVGWQ